MSPRKVRMQRRAAFESLETRTLLSAVPLVAPPVSDPTVLTLSGTTRRDTFQLAPNTTGGWTVTINGKAQAVAPEVTTIQFDGLKGQDTVTVLGKAADEMAELWSDHMTFQSGNLKLAAKNIEFVTVTSNGGIDQATFHDSKSADKFTATATDAVLTGSGYSARTIGFKKLDVYGGTGGADQVYLYGALTELGYIDKPVGPGTPTAQVAWLHNFKKITTADGTKLRDRLRAKTQTVDQVVTASWPQTVAPV